MTKQELNKDRKGRMGKAEERTNKKKYGKKDIWKKKENEMGKERRGGWMDGNSKND